MACKCAVRSDGFYSWKCAVTGGSCEFFIPNSKRCAKMFGEGPDAYEEEEKSLEGEASESV